MILDKSPINWLAKVFLYLGGGVEMERRGGVLKCDRRRYGGMAGNWEECIGRLTLKPSVKMRWASLNSGVEKERRGSSFFLMSSSFLTCWRISSSSA